MVLAADYSAIPGIVGGSVGLPLPLLRHAAAAWGLSILTYDTDPTVRQHCHGTEEFPGLSWVAAKTALDPKTPFNFASTNDIVGGNSGSAVVNRKGELVGLIFDMNIQALPGYFFYDESVNRAVSVDSRAILESLRKIYKADPLANEIAGTPAAGK